MTDLLVLANRLRNVISLGESHFREFKSALEGPPQAKKPRKAALICAEVGEALVAFARWLSSFNYLRPLCCLLIGGFRMYEAAPMQTKDDRGIDL